MTTQQRYENLASIVRRKGRQQPANTSGRIEAELRRIEAGRLDRIPTLGTDLSNVLAIAEVLRVQGFLQKRMPATLFPFMVMVPRSAMSN